MTYSKLKSILLYILPFMFLTAGAQDLKKIKLSVDYEHQVGVSQVISVQTKYKEGKTYVPGEDVNINIYELIENDSLVFKSSIKTDKKGIAKYVVSDLRKADTSLLYTFYAKVENSDLFKDASKKVKFYQSKLSLELNDKDSIPEIVATLEGVHGNKIKGEKISIAVERLFAPLGIGESSYKTNGKGKVSVAFLDPLPSADGNLTFIASMDSKKYGIVTTKIILPIGIVAKDESTYDQRTMWSPPNKTPLFLLIFPNLVILAIWVTIVLLIRNLFKIYNLKENHHEN